MAQQQLEQRVKTLEYEIKILKNELQRTLLDIQEQILIHYYPTLRKQDDAPSDGIVQAFESIQGQKGPAEKTPTPAPVKNISLEEVRAMKEETPDSSRVEPSSQSGAEMSQDDLVQLSGWVSKTVKRMGGERTRKLIQAYTEKGFVTPKVERFLLKLIGLGDDEPAPDKVEMKETLNIILDLNKLLGRKADVETALSLIEEADLG